MDKLKREKLSQMAKELHVAFNKLDATHQEVAHVMGMLTRCLKL